jgi:DUF971 family protein
MTMSAHPLSLSLLPDGKLAIEWSDGRRMEYAAEDLRRKCPCATCVYGRESAERTVEAAEIADSIAFSQVLPVGNYAYNIRFSDGHSTGIFSLDMLSEWK